jgi:hypothetical protein
MSYKTVAEIRSANKALGHHFFDKDTMEFFRSAVYNDVYGGRYFITSEQFVASDGEAFPREYTIREAHDDGSIETVDLPKYQSLADAQARIEIFIARGW